MSTATTVLLPIIAALSVAEQQPQVGKNPQWHSNSAKQSEFLHQYMPLTNQLSKLSEQELSSIASTKAEEINSFLKQKGFNITLKPFNKEDDFGVAAILNILLKWKKEGHATQLTDKNKQVYDAVTMKHSEFCTVGSVTGENVVIIKTQNNDIVYLKPLSENQKPLTDFQLLEEGKRIIRDTLPHEKFDKVIFPMVTINEQSDISWLLKMRLTGSKGRFFISQALQQTKFQMNEKGAAVQSAAAIAIARGCASLGSSFIIDKPFYIWIKREGIDIPFFAAYIDTDSWKKPEALGK